MAASVAIPLADQPPSPAPATSWDAQLSADIRALRQMVAEQYGSIQQLIEGQRRLEERLADGRVPPSRTKSSATAGSRNDAAPGIGAQMNFKQAKRRDSRGSSIGALSSRSHWDARSTLFDARFCQKGSAGSRKLRTPNRFQRISQHPAFEYVSAAFILIHSLVIGAYVEYLAVQDGKQHPALDALNWVCVSIFMGEVTLKILADHREYFTGFWNVFDCALVVLLVVDIIMHIMHVHDLAAMAKIGEMISAGRVLYILKCLELSVTFQILFSLKSLFWVLLLVFMLLYLVAVCIAQGVVDYLGGQQHADGFRPSDLSKNGLALFEQFGSVEKSLYTLFQSITGGQLWGDSAAILSDVHTFYAALFITFIAMTTLCILNIVTGIFVDATIMSAKHQRDEMMDTERLQQQAQAAHLKEVFSEIDTEGSGRVPLEQFQEMMQDERVRIFLYSMKIRPIQTSDVKRLFHMLDQDGSGEIVLEEFVNGCMHLQGDARNFDMHRLLSGQRQLQRNLDGLAQAAGIQRAVSQVTTRSRWASQATDGREAARESTVDAELGGIVNQKCEL